MISYVDVCCGLAWGDEAKGKIVAYLAKSGRYDYVCRWAGGNNAGHTVHVNNIQYVTHLVPSGIFYDIPSIIGPGCVINEESFKKEIEYLQNSGFNTGLVKISPKAHVVSDKHIEEDKNKYYKTQGTTAKGIAPCYRDKFGRIGTRAENITSLKPYMWDEKLSGAVLCEGAQGFWLDIDYGNYPYVTSSTTLPYGACSLGFSPRLIRTIYGAAKMYDTRSGTDPDFPETLLSNPDLLCIADIGQEYGATTGRRRKTNWLNIDKLIQAINTSGTTQLIMSKGDVLEEANLYRLIFDSVLVECKNINEMKETINEVLRNSCPLLLNIVYSTSPETVTGLDSEKS